MMNRRDAVFRLLLQAAAQQQPMEGKERDVAQRQIVAAFKALGVDEREVKSAATVLPYPLNEDWPWHRELLDGDLFD